MMSRGWGGLRVPTSTSIIIHEQAALVSMDSTFIQVSGGLDKVSSPYYPEVFEPSEWLKSVRERVQAVEIQAYENDAVGSGISSVRR